MRVRLLPSDQRRATELWTRIRSAHCVSDRASNWPTATQKQPSTATATVSRAALHRRRAGVSWRVALQLAPAAFQLRARGPRT